MRQHASQPRAADDRKDLSIFFGSRSQLLFIELACSRQSVLCRAACEAGVSYIGVHAHLEKPDVIKSVIAAIAEVQTSASKTTKQQMQVHVHISLPCTGGSPLRRFSNKNPSDPNDPHVKEYHDLLRSCVKILKGIELCDCSISLELPNTSVYWSDPKVKDFLDTFGLWYRAIVHACAMGLTTKNGEKIKKAFRIMCTSEEFAHTLEKRFECSCVSHSPFNEVNWRETENYSMTFGRFFVRVLNLRMLNPLTAGHSVNGSSSVST